VTSPASERQHIVLIGLPGSGKTVSGRALAAILETPFTDLDLRIAEQAGLSIPAIFSRGGEAAFRRLEQEAMRRALASAPHVVAPGGGWACQTDNLQSVEGKALLVHLRVSPATAAARLGAGHGRPLLGDDPLAALQRLGEERAPWYQRAAIQVDTEGVSPADVAARIAALAASRAGW